MACLGNSATRERKGCYRKRYSFLLVGRIEWNKRNLLTSAHEFN